MKPPPRQMVVSFLGMLWIYPPPRMPVTNKGLYGLNVVLLVVTVTGWEVKRRYAYQSLEEPLDNIPHIAICKYFY